MLKRWPMGKLIITGCLTFFPQYIKFNPLYTENRIIGTLAKIMLPNIERIDREMGR